MSANVAYQNNNRANQFRRLGLHNNQRGKNFQNYNGGNIRHNGGNYGGYFGNNSNAGNPNFQYQRGRNNQNYRGGSAGTRGGRTNNLGSRPQCQICKKQDHIAVDCWFRFDQNAQETHQANLTTAMVASQEMNDDCWYPDLGATDHCTANSSNLQQMTEYRGQNKVYISNGTGPTLEEGSL